MMFILAWCLLTQYVLSQLMVNHNDPKLRSKNYYNDKDPPLSLKFRPFVVITAGCLPYSAVNAAGDYSAGLHGSYSSDSDCNGDPAFRQIYSRQAGPDQDGLISIAYALFMPKSKQKHHHAHRYKWDVMVVHVVPGPIRLELDSIWTPMTGRTKSFAVVNKHPVVQKGFFEQGELINTYFGEEVGNLLPLADWTGMTPAMLAVLNTQDFGANPCPLRDTAFADLIESSRKRI